MSPTARPPHVEEEEEDDYMTMTFAEPPAKTETPLQRRQREKREAERRGRVKSKAELAAEEKARREAALSRSLIPDDGGEGEGGGEGLLAAGAGAAKKQGDKQKPAKSKGLAMMARMGFKGGVLGAGDNPDARAEPIPISVREGKEGIGADAERKRQMAELEAEAEERVKRARVDGDDFRDRVRREREAARLERLVNAAQRLAKCMYDERREREAKAEAEAEGDEDGDGNITETGTTAEPRARIGAGSAAATGGDPVPDKRSRPLLAVPVLWRGLVRARERAERDRRMRYDVEQGLAAARSRRRPTYEDDLEGPDERLALGRTEVGAAEDEDDEDAELDEFEELPPQDRLRRLVEFLRRDFRYCFWCKFAYPDDAMEGCPGLTEEDHD